MQDFGAAFAEAFQRLAALDPDLVEIVLLSLQVTLSAVVLACLIGLPLGAILAVTRFPGRAVLATFVTAMMGLPPVVVGLVVYLMLSAAGPFGVLGLLYTPTAMIIAQTILVAPIIAALTQQAVHDRHAEYRDLLTTLGASRWQMVKTLLWEARFALVTASLAGFGRALAEVGAVMIVGGNINHLTRVMTTTIALETSRGNLALALGLGVILIGLSVMVTAALSGVRRVAEARAYG